MTSPTLPLRLSDLHMQAMVGTPLTCLSVAFDKDVSRVQSLLPNFSDHITCLTTKIALREGDVMTESELDRHEIRLHLLRLMTFRPQHGLALVFLSNYQMRMSLKVTGSVAVKAAFDTALSFPTNMDAMSAAQKATGR